MEAEEMSRKASGPTTYIDAYELGRKRGLEEERKRTSKQLEWMAQRLDALSSMLGEQIRIAERDVVELCEREIVAKVRVSDDFMRRADRGVLAEAITDTLGAALKRAIADDAGGPEMIAKDIRSPRRDKERRA